MTTGPIDRRQLLKWALGGAAVCSAGDVHAIRAAQSDPRALLPKEGDRLVFALGRRKGQPVSPADVRDGVPVVAIPQDDGGSADGSRLNQVVLVRLPVDAMAPETAQRAADGVVAYSAICTHTGCDATEWDDGDGVLLCPCHDSRFDPRDAARVVAGPAPRPLAALPLRIVDGALVVAASFIGRVGASEVP